LQKVSSLTEHFTGADIKLLCKEAAMVPVRTILEQLEETNVNDCHSSNQRSCQKTNIQVLLKRHPITIDIFMTSLEKTMPSIDAKDSIRYEQWAKKHGSI
jgi:katanin p60 ATPase-containing subunit A1